MNWQDYESLGHLELKGKLVEYLSNRTKIIKEMEQSSEYEYCEIQGRTKELDELINKDNFKLLDNKIYNVNTKTNLNYPWLTIDPSTSPGPKFLKF